MKLNIRNMAVQYVRIALLLALGLTAGGSALAESEREHFTVESGRLQSVSATPLSVTIDNQVLLVTEETHLDGHALKGEDGAIAARLRRLVGRDVGYDWYRVPGNRPVVVTMTPIKVEQ